MKFSILIANYNNGKYFRECYDSLIDQTYQNWEVIIVDDGSTDDSLVVIHALTQGDSRFKIYSNEVNKGCGYTKKSCVEYASGDICGFVDPDDALHRQALELSIKAFEDNSKIVAAYSKFMMCDELLNPLYIFRNTKQIYNNRYFFNCLTEVTHFFTFKREVYLKTSGINPHLVNAVDQDLYLKIFEFGNAVFIDKVLYLYRIHANGISQKDSKQSAKDSFSKVILETMHRRGIKKIFTKRIPDQYTNSDEVYALVKHQGSVFYRTGIKLLSIIWPV
ncbi:glycosyl transferase family 2 [Chryseobacterium lactis]|uniref:Glycosyl transferase family 2 n=1 Tax=Chryseobacterium lactis TaxID=1241981 RepID=A0A3G6RKY3_CHRLC|nr:glycosyltransferase [Chryseobacterium lactis]AZA83505.1 glycosyltransferase [Chryseobacterium lactis]AZB03889.1 glycosyltransferase [Chryseobacterium lactis]PNW13201.1 glycosyl transferase family 2 [Chryseobacterium lactis]